MQKKMNTAGERARLFDGTRRGGVRQGRRGKTTAGTGEKSLLDMARDENALTGWKELEESEGETVINEELLQRAAEYATAMYSPQFF